MYMKLKGVLRMYIVWVIQASERVQHNLAAAASRRAHKNFDVMTKISKNVVENGGAFQVHPLGY